MRITAAILALLIALLSCLPCADLDAAPLRSVSQEASLHSADAPGHSHEGLDLCSPFCHCACCAIATEVAVPFSFTLRKLTHGPVHFHDFIPAIPVHISIPVWEPPR